MRPIDANALIKEIQEARRTAWFGSSEGKAYYMEKSEYAEGWIANAPELSLNTLRDENYEDAVAHGLWMDTDGPMRCASQIDGEVRELFEEAGNVLDVRVDGGDETEVWEAYCEELADVIITCFSAAGKLGIDIDAAIKRKMEKNKTRPWKHGKESV